jgi:hypothetical protein
MSVSGECCVMSGRGLCDGLVPRPEESYRMWCVSNVCDHETSMKRGGPGPYRAVEPYKKKSRIMKHSIQPETLSKNIVVNESPFFILLHHYCGLSRPKIIKSFFPPLQINQAT